MPEQRPQAIYGAAETACPDSAVPWGKAGSEPEISDVLSDPLVHLVMRRDGVTLPALRAVVAAAQGKLRRGLCRGRCLTR